MLTTVLTGTAFSETQIGNIVKSVYCTTLEPINSTTDYIPPDTLPQECKEVLFTIAKSKIVKNCLNKL